MKVYLLVEADVEDSGVVNGDVAVSRAARTLGDVIFDGTEERNDRGMIVFQSYGKVALNHPTIVSKETTAYIDARRAAMREHELNHDSEEPKPWFFGPWEWDKQK